jgi:hypothetical protein
MIDGWSDVSMDLMKRTRSDLVQTLSFVLGKVAVIESDLVEIRVELEKSAASG